MASNVGWNKNVPSGTSSIAQGDDDIRSFKSFMQAAWEEEHYFTDGSSNSAGIHKLGSARAYVGPSSQLSNPQPGRVFWLTDEHDIAVAASASSWSKLGAARTGSVNTWTAQQNFSRDSALQYLQTGRVTGDSNERIILRADGAMFWGSGATTEDTNLYRAGADHLKTDGTFEASVISTPTLQGITQFSLGTLQVGGGVNIRGIYQFTVVFPATSIGPGSEQQVTTPNTSSLTSGDILICEQEPLPESRSWVRAWVVPSTGVIAVRRRNLSSDLTLSFSTATINVLGFDIT